MIPQAPPPLGTAHVQCAQLLLYRQLVLVQAAELVDLVLVLAAHLDLVAHRIFLLLRQLRSVCQLGYCALGPDCIYHPPAHHLDVFFSGVSELEGGRDKKWCRFRAQVGALDRCLGFRDRAPPIWRGIRDACPPSINPNPHKRAFSRGRGIARVSLYYPIGLSSPKSTNDAASLTTQEHQPTTQPRESQSIFPHPKSLRGT